MKEFLNDLLATIFFFAVYSLLGDIFIATGAAIAVGVFQVAYMRWHGRAIDAMQWLSLGLVVVLGGITILTSNPHFIMVKPSLIHFAIAAVMLRRGWMARYLPPIATANLPPATVIAWGYAWAALMIGLALANLTAVFTMDVHSWAWFITTATIGAKLVLFSAQYITFRSMVIRRIRLQRAAMAAAG